MAIKKLTKKEIDENVLRLLLLDEAMKKIKKEHTNLKSVLEAQYIEDKNIKELISGSVCEYEKIPVNKGAHNYDPDKTKVYTDACGKTAEIIHNIPVVNNKEFEKLAKIGIIPETVLGKCRIDNWTFKTDFRRKESTTQGAKINQPSIDEAVNKILKEVNDIKVLKKTSKKKAAGQ